MKLKKIIQYLLFSSILLFSASGCEEECNDECKLQQSFLYWIIYGTDGYAFRYFQPCLNADFTMNPGEEKVLTLPENSLNSENIVSGAYVVACSEKKWKLTITPLSETGYASIWAVHRPGLLESCTSEFLAASSSKGEAVSIEGEGGCIPEGWEGGISITYSSPTPEDQFRLTFE